ncbi:MAG: DsbA family protein [Rhizobiales bacterium]|nr:DsbA family protein [Hyphomicrobiales bacterium]
MKFSPLRLAKLALSSLMGLMMLMAPVAAGSLDATQQDEVRQIIREYLIENPEVIAEALEMLEIRSKQKEENARNEALASMQDLIFNSDKQVVMGNPDGDVTVVEFFDYNCGFCKRAHKDMVDLMAEDKGLRIVLKEFPVLGQGSVEAARIAIALNAMAPELYEEFHMKLLLNPGAANLDKALNVAESLGVDIQELESIVNSELPSQTIQEVYQIADTLGLTGTPSYVIGKQVVFGAVGVERLRASIAEARANKS